MATKPTKTGSKKAPPFVAMKKGGQSAAVCGDEKGKQSADGMQRVR